MHRLRGAEIKVFLYISRRTLGFKKRVDAIGMDQLMNGIRTRKGRRLDHGTGLSESGVKKAVRGCLIRRVRQKDPQCQGRSKDHFGGAKVDQLVKG